MALLLLFPLLFLVARVTAGPVFAHFMVQNSYSYSQSDWAKDIADAKGIGIDGFTLNIAGNDYEFERIVQAYAAADATGFKFHFSFDLNYDWSQDRIANLVAEYANRPSTYRWNNAVLVSTFNGAAKGPDWWNYIRVLLTNRGVAMSFAPAFIDWRDPSRAQGLFSAFPGLDGFFNWWSWPNDVNTTLTTDTDMAYKNALKAAGRTGPYIMSVSPWQFKDLPGGQNWVQQSDTLWNYRWKQAIDTVKPDIVQIVSWNDYAESHYIGDINPNVYVGDAGAYITGFTHSAWRVIAQYYISWYKSGTVPAITQDKVIVWYRVHPRAVTCSAGDTVRMSTFPADAVFALALVTSSSSAATINIDIGTSHSQFTAASGVATMGQAWFPAEDNQAPIIRITKNGATRSLAGLKPVTVACPYYNFNPFVAVL